MAQAIILLPLLFILAVIVAARCNQTLEGKIEAESTTRAVQTVSLSTAVLVKPVYTESPKSTVDPVVEDEPEYLHSEDVPLPEYLQETLQRACEEYCVPYSLALAIVENESSFDLEADNGTCWGLMQINPINYEWLRELGIEPTEYEGNIVAGVLMIGQLLDKYGDTHKALMAYNCGESGAARLWEQGYSSSEYSRQVISLAEKWQQIIEA